MKIKKFFESYVEMILDEGIVRYGYVIWAIIVISLICFKQYDSAISLASMWTGHIVGLYILYRITER